MVQTLSSLIDDHEIPLTTNLLDREIDQLPHSSQFTSVTDQSNELPTNEISVEQPMGNEPSADQPPINAVPTVQPLETSNQHQANQLNAILVIENSLGEPASDRFSANQPTVNRMVDPSSPDQDISAGSYNYTQCIHLGIYSLCLYA